MMSQKHLHELLKEDQEPFLLQNYIADRQCLLKKPPPNTQHLLVKKRKHISDTSIFTGNFCKNACLFSFNDSSDLRKSPLFEFHSPAAKSPCNKNPNSIFLHIPTRTAALLLEAALRIQQKQSSYSKTKTVSRSHGLGLFGSFFKRLTNRNCSRKGENESDVGLSSSNGRRSRNGENPLEFELSCSSHCEYSEEIDLFSQEPNRTANFPYCENHLCGSPFRFVLQQSSPPSQPAPEFSSPTTSPSRQRTEDKMNYDVESLKKLQVDDEEEDKEQCSPVSVLDPPFEDDDDGHHDNDNDSDNDDGFDMECSYAILQKAKQQLLNKLRRFEKLAELDPIELEKRMLEVEDEEDEDNDDDDTDYPNEEGEYGSYDSESIANKVVNNSSLANPDRLPKYIKRLVLDLVSEEGRDRSRIDDTNETVKRVFKRLECWKEVETDTIDMMVDHDFEKELVWWKKNQEQKGDMAVDIELSIFSFLVEELTTELVFSTPIQ